MAYGYGDSKDDVSSFAHSRGNARGISTQSRPPTAPTTSAVNHSHASASHLAPHAGPFRHRSHHTASSSSETSSDLAYAHSSRSFDRVPSYSADGSTPRHHNSSRHARDDTQAYGAGDASRRMEAVNVFGALRPRVVAPPEFDAPLAEIEAAVAVAAAKRAETGRYYGRGGAANRSRTSAFGSFGPLLVPSPPIQHQQQAQQRHQFSQGASNGTASGSSTASSADGRHVVADVGWADRGKAALRLLTRKRAVRTASDVGVVGFKERA